MSQPLLLHISEQPPLLRFNQPQKEWPTELMSECPLIFEV